MSSAGYPEKDVEAGKPFAAVGYVPLCCFIPTFLVPMFAAKDNTYAQFHARQGAVLYIVTLVSGIALWVLTLIAQHLGSMISCMASLAGLAWFGVILTLIVLGIINALQGQAKELPVIGPFAASLPF